MINLQIALALLSGSLACVRVDGGAIEADWVLRSFDGRAIVGCGCADPAIVKVRFSARVIDTAGAMGDAGQPGEDVCAGRADCEFSCDSLRGATPFFVNPGRYALAVTPIDATGQAVPAGVGQGFARVPAPILRDVVNGQPTELDALAIEASCSATCGGDVTSRSCER